MTDFELEEWMNAKISVSTLLSNAYKRLPEDDKKQLAQHARRVVAEREAQTLKV